MIDSWITIDITQDCNLSGGILSPPMLYEALQTEGTVHSKIYLQSSYFVVFRYGFSTGQFSRYSL